MKCLSKLVLVAVLLVALLIGGMIALIDPIVEAAVTEGVAFATQQETSLESADVGLFSGELAFSGLEIANPPGFQEAPLIKLGRFETALAISGLASDVIELENVELHGLDLALELKGSETNVTQLVKRLHNLQEELKRARRVMGDDDSQSAPPLEQSEQVLKIQRIEISGVSASLRVSDIPLIKGVYSFEIPDLVLENFGDDMQGATLVEWSAHVLEAVISSALIGDESQLPPEIQRVLRTQLIVSGTLDLLLQGDLEEIDRRLKDEAMGIFDDLIQGLEEDPTGELQKKLEDIKKDADTLEQLFGGGN